MIDASTPPDPGNLPADLAVRPAPRCGTGPAAGQRASAHPRKARRIIAALLLGATALLGVAALQAGPAEVNRLKREIVLTDREIARTQLSLKEALASYGPIAGELGQRLRDLKRSRAELEKALAAAERDMAERRAQAEAAAAVAAAQREQQASPADAANPTAGLPLGGQTGP